MTMFAAHTDAGAVKPIDQDAHCFKEARACGRRVLMAVVCDGVGGLAKGELASSTVVRRFSDWFDSSLPAFLAGNASEGKLDWSALRKVWDALLQTANKHVCEHGRKADQVCGTTFTGMFVYGDAYLIAHVGDCRAYEVASRAIRQLTKDQTLVAQQVDAGILTPEEAAHHPKRNVIMQSVGTQEGVNPDFVQGAFNPASTYVLCCDGFYARLNDGELLRAFTPGACSDDACLQRACERLTDAVLERGERDNITVVAFGAYDDEDDELDVATTLLDDLDGDDAPTTVVRGGETL